jgi:hypothetical protein
LRGETGAVEGVDYRGVPVVAVGRRVPGTPWAIIGKVDQQEIYAPLQRETATVCMILATLVLASALLMLLLWRQRSHELLVRSKESLRQLNKELERRVYQRTAELETKNRELETFAYSVSHDLKAPVRSIEGFAHVLLDEHLAQLDASGREYLERVLQSAERMRQLIDDLLSYSRLELEDVKWSAVDLRGLVQRLLEEFRREIDLAKTRVKVEIQCAPLKTDAAGLEQAMRNLIGNAIKFSARSPAPQVEILARDGDGFCHVTVRDNGIGFDMKYQERIFQVFQRLHPVNEYPGTGIGLAIVRKAMQRMGGKVRVESAPGQGADFFLEIPRRKE